MTSKNEFFVDHSLNKARWRVPDVPLADIEGVVRQHDLPEVVARLLLGRGIQGDQIPSFINPTLRDHFPDPFALAGMEELAVWAAKAVQDGKHFTIFGDFDVDGATSSAILYRFLKACGIDARVYIPDRLDEGYGPNVKAFQTLKDEGADIIFVLDCGITAFDVIEKGRGIGLDIVIVDHHEAEEQLPVANHVINPKRKDDQSNMEMLAAVGVTFMVCVAINKVLREAGFFEGRDEPDLKNFLDLVCLGTVCDMVPLTGVNRLLVRHGFTIMNQMNNIGIQQLAMVSDIHPPFNPYHLGFGLGPRINAGGRIHKSELGAELLCTDDEERAKEIAWILQDCNDKRRDIQKQMEDEAVAKVEREGLENDAAVIVADEGWHPGLSGLVAGRLREKYDKPACVVAYTPLADGGMEGRGSGRSVPGVHIAEAFIDARNEGLIPKGGGHAMAGGFTIGPDQFDAFKSFICAHVERQMKEAQSHVVCDVDSIMSVQGANVELISLLENYIGPFGMDFEEPLFAFHNVRVHSADIMKDKHIKLMISDWEGGTRIKAVKFGAVGTPLGDALLKQGRQPFHILGKLKINRWQGRESAELMIEDAAFVHTQDQKLAI